MSVERPVDRAKEVAAAARDDPTSVDRAELRRLLGSDASEARRYALQAFRRVDWAGDEGFEAFVPRLRDCLDADDALLRNAAVQALADVAAVDHELVEPAVGDVTDLFDDEQELVRSSVTDLLFYVGRENPTALEPAVPQLLELVEASDPLQCRDAVYCLGLLARERPEPLVPVVECFVDVFTTERDPPSLNTSEVESPLDADRMREAASNEAERVRGVRTAAGIVLVAVARHDPVALEGSVEDVARFLDDPDPQIQGVVVDALGAIGRGHPEMVEKYLTELAATLADAPSVSKKAARALASLAQSRPTAVTDAVEPHVDEVVELLDHEEPDVRGLCAGLLTYVGEEFPGTVEPALDRVRPLLDDEHAFVRGNAVWTLGIVGGERARDALVEVGRSDPNLDVRRAADDVIDQL